MQGETLLSRGVGDDEASVEGCLLEVLKMVTDSELR